MNIDKELNQLLYRSYNLLQEFSKYVTCTFPVKEDIKSSPPAVKVAQLYRYKDYLWEAVRLTELLDLEEADKDLYLEVRKLKTIAKSINKRIKVVCEK